MTDYSQDGITYFIGFTDTVTHESCVCGSSEMKYMALKTAEIMVANPNRKGQIIDIEEIEILAGKQTNKQIYRKVA